VEEAFVTWQKVAVSGNTARVSTDKGVLEITADQGVFTVEALEEACKANHRKEMLTRIALTRPAAPAVATRFTMHYAPAK